MAGLSRRSFVVASAVSLAVPVACHAQGAGRVRRIGWLTAGSPVSHARPLAAFREGLKERGWVEGRSVVLELRWAEGDLKRLPELAAETVKAKPDVIVTAANAVTLAMREATATIPIVMATGSDPVASGLAKSMARPGGNVTGLTGFYESTPYKMLELVTGIVPRNARVALLIDRSFSIAVMRDEMRRKLEQSAAVAALRLQWLEAATIEELLQAVAGLAQDRPAALLVLPGAQVFAAGQRIVERAQALRVPVVYPFEELVDAGGLMSYAPDLPDSYRRAARYVDLILKGANPAELPIEQPTRLALAINARTAKAQGVVLPQALLTRADRILE
jgi:putative ABC transport system substrate-binding protein